MNTSEYHFISHWQVSASPIEVYGIISNSNELPRWWPAVYLDSKVMQKGDANGLGKVVAVNTKGWLPYSLQWSFIVKNINKPYRIEIEAIGDLKGKGIWTFEANETGTLIGYDWKIEANKPLLKKLSWLLKPAFSANHHWAMKKGEESLKLEIRRIKGEKELPKPPKPTFPHNLLNNKIFKTL